MGQITGKGLTFDNGRTIDNFIWQFYLTSSDILGEDLDVGNPHQAAHPLWHIAVIHDSIEACESMNTVPFTFLKTKLHKFNLHESSLNMLKTTANKLLAI